MQIVRRRRAGGPVSTKRRPAPPPRDRCAGGDVRGRAVFVVTLTGDSAARRPRNRGGGGATVWPPTRRRPRRHAGKPTERIRGGASPSAADPPAPAAEPCSPSAAVRCCVLASTWWCPSSGPPRRRGRGVPGGAGRRGPRPADRAHTAAARAVTPRGTMRPRRRLLASRSRRYRPCRMGSGRRGGRHLSNGLAAAVVYWRYPAQGAAAGGALRAPSRWAAGGYCDGSVLSTESRVVPTATAPTAATGPPRSSARPCPTSRSSCRRRAREPPPRGVVADLRGRPRARRRPRPPPLATPARRRRGHRSSNHRRRLRARARWAAASPPGSPPTRPADSNAENPTPPNPRRRSDAAEPHNRTRRRWGPRASGRPAVIARRQAVATHGRATIDDAGGCGSPPATSPAARGLRRRPLRRELPARGGEDRDGARGSSDPADARLARGARPPPPYSRPAVLAPEGPYGRGPTGSGPATAHSAGRKRRASTSPAPPRVRRRGRPALLVYVPRWHASA